MATALHPQRAARKLTAGPLHLFRAKTPDEVELLETPWRALDALGG